jgi:hypothetical protein
MSENDARTKIQEQLNDLRTRPEVFFSRSEIEKAKKLAEKIENMQEVNHAVFGFGIEFTIKGRDYGIYVDRVKCADCKSNCIHKLALAIKKTK